MMKQAGEEQSKKVSTWQLKETERHCPSGVAMWRLSAGCGEGAGRQ